MDAKKVQQHCDVLRDLISVGPGASPEVLRRALGILRSLRAAAEWDYPQQILEDLKRRIIIWFSDRMWRGDEAEQHRDLLQQIEQLPPSWDQPRAE